MTDKPNYTPDWQETVSQTPFDLRVRNDLTWDYSNVVDPKFVEGDLIHSVFWAAISAASPPLEGFFIKVLRPYLAENIKGDDKLAKDVKGMLDQEACHSKAHRIFNDCLQELGYDMRKCEQYYREEINNLVEGFDEADMLGLISGGEHGLYSLANAFLNDKAIKKIMHPEVYKLFFYHFIEEAEHGAVSHDQYKYVVGKNYAHRVKTVNRVAGKIVKMFANGCKILLESLGESYDLKNRLRLQYIFWIYPGLNTKMVKELVPYYMPWYNLEFNSENMAEIQSWHKELYIMDERTKARIADQSNDKKSTKAGTEAPLKSVSNA